MMGTLAWSAAALALLAASVLKAADRTGATVALSGYGVPGRLAAPAWAALVVVEAGLAAALAAGVRWAPTAATVLLAVFALGQAGALLRGGAGTPCGCFGARGRLSPGSLGRTAALAALCALLPLLGDGPQLPLALSAALAAGAVVLALGRSAPAPDGALEVAGEGPPLGAPDAVALPGDGLRLALFTSGCRLCRRVERAADVLAAHGVAVHRFDERDDAAAWAAASVPGAPYAIAVAPDGTVVAKGTVNSGAQLESVLAAGESRWAAAGESSRAADAEARWAAAGETPAVGRGTSRRSFLSRVGGAAAAVTGAGAVGALVRPGDAQAYHFCGHIYTTDGCPHPTGLPRIDRDGFPLRAADGRAVDDLGRVIDRFGRPLGEDGALLADFEGRPLPVAPRTRVCSATARTFGIEAQIDGAWFRCCHGRVRKLVDCCSTSDLRINGDASLRGYCYKDRKVFCVMYFQTSVPC